MENDFEVRISGDDKAWHVVLTPHQGPDPMAMRIRSITVDGGRFVNHVEIAKPDGDSDDLVFLDQMLSEAPLAADESAALDASAR